MSIPPDAERLAAFSLACLGRSPISLSGIGERTDGMGTTGSGRTRAVGRRPLPWSPTTPAGSALASGVTGWPCVHGGRCARPGKGENWRQSVATPVSPMPLGGVGAAAG